MAEAQPVLIARAFKGVNRIIAPHMLDETQSPDAADCGPSSDVGLLLSPRRGRKPIQSLSFPIRGVVPLNLPWVKLQLVALADGTIVPQTIVDPSFFNDVGSYLAFDPASQRYIVDNGGWYQTLRDTLATEQWTFTDSSHIQVQWLAGGAGSTGVRAAIAPSWSGSANGSGLSIVINNTGSVNCTCTMYHDVADAGHRWLGFPLVVNAGASSVVFSYPPAGGIGAGQNTVIFEVVPASGPAGAKVALVVNPWTP